MTRNGWPLTHPRSQTSCRRTIWRDSHRLVVMDRSLRRRRPVSTNVRLAQRILSSAPRTFSPIQKTSNLTENGKRSGLPRVALRTKTANPTTCP